MKLRRVIGSFIRMPWIPLLDQITDACEDGAEYLGPLSILVRPCCKPVIALGWFYGLHELRAATAKQVDRVKTAYYNPREDAIRAWYAQWRNRLLLAAGTLATAYVSTFYVYPGVVRPYVSMSWLMVEDDDLEHSSYISTVAKVDRATGEERVYTLVSKSIIKCIARQSEVAVWVLGTLLRLPKKRFLPLWFANMFVSPLATGIAENSGNFALWMSMGLALSKVFQLYPSSKEKYVGTLGTSAALLASAVMLPSKKKIGQTETVLSMSVICLTELGAHYALLVMKGKINLFLKKFQRKEKEEDEKDKSQREKPNVLIRAWRYLTSDKETSLSSSWPEFSYPSYGAWAGLAAAWVSIGLAVDGV